MNPTIQSISTAIQQYTRGFGEAAHTLAQADAGDGPPARPVAQPDENQEVEDNAQTEERQVQRQSEESERTMVEMEHNRRGAEASIALLRATHQTVGTLLDTFV